MSLKGRLQDNIKNIFGWKTNRKLLVISVDDYGNVRVDSKRSRENLDRAGLKVQSRFDAFDSLETENDLFSLFDVLTSVKDANGRSAIFTPFCVPCNLNFEKIIESNYSQFHYELLPETFQKLAGYQNVYAVWKEGISKGFLSPQFHGREHLNLMIFNDLLAKKNQALISCINNRSYSSLSFSSYPTVSYTAAFEFVKFEENKRFHEIIIDGLNCFEKVFGFRATHFNSPGGREHPVIHRSLQDGGVKYLDTPWIKKEHQGDGHFKRIINYTGKKNYLGHTYLVRNCVFEPTYANGIDWVNHCMRQVESAFKWRRPAIISSHRVNFCGNIDEANRVKGLSDLKRLLKLIIRKWPDVEFLAAHELAGLVETEVKDDAFREIA